ncbi:tail sheath protein [uncultured Caudovirales phage]|uniref:Tail sheath protein n=1 Tax=uncultured Caudovirales phage TaxID=2100421 RepID=A0A6J5M8V0_9CAUD|nr:tail sheath protein [uncultured Caudovirales phage]
MAEKIVSPGVFTRENDLSFLQQGVADIGTAFIGPFKEGPLVPTIVNTQAEFEQMFGRVDDTYYTPIAVQSYLREAGAATICRVAGVGGYIEKAPVLLTAVSQSVSASVGILFNTNTSGNSFSVGFNVTSNVSSSLDFVVSGSNLSGSFSTSLDPTDVSDIASVFGTDARGTKQSYVYGFFVNKANALLTANSSVTFSVLPNQDFTFDAQEAKTPYIQSQLISGQRYNLFRFETIGAGNAANTKVKVAITNIKPAGSVAGTDYGTFTVVVRAYEDTNRRKTVYETYSNVTLDPASPNYIYRVIGDRHITIDASGKVTETGDWVNKSKYVRLVNSERDATISYEKIPVQAVPFGHDAYKLPVSGSTAAQSNLIPAVTYTAASSTTFGGIDLDSNGDNAIYIKPIPVGASTGSNVGYSLDGTDGFAITGSAAVDIAKRNFIVAFQEGWDGADPTKTINKAGDITSGNVQGFDCSSLTASGSIAYLKQINALSNADEYDIQMVVTPGLNFQEHRALVNAVLDMVESRGDAFYIMEGVGYNGSINDVRTQAGEIDSNYAGMYYPWVKTTDANTNRLISIPPSTLLPAVYAANDRVAAEWFAPAGLNRGGLTGAVAVLNKLTQTDRDNLYEDKVNPIVQFPGQGIVAFGQKTLQDKPSALDRINVRRLLLTVRKYIASTSRFLVFEQNTSTTRNRFLNIVNPYLEGIQQRQGLYAFKVVMDESNNTPDSIDRNFLNGSIYLQPTKTAEFIQIDFNILPTGATFGG